MNRNGTKPKRGRPQKLIIPKGTLDNSDTTVIEIPQEYRNQEIVIAKKSNVSNYYPTFDQSVNTSSSHRTVYQPIYQPINQPITQSQSQSQYRRQNESACQTPYNESDIEKLMEDLEAYYHAQKNFLIKSSTLLKRQIEECQTKKSPSMCSCNQPTSSTTGCSPTVVLMNRGCSQENIPSCSFESQYRKPEYQPSNQTWGRNESPRVNMSGSYYSPDLSMPRNVTQFSTNTSNQQSFIDKNTSSATNQSFWPKNENNALQSTAISYPDYDSFREGISKNADVSRSQYGTPSTSATSSQIRFDTTYQPPNRSILKTTNTDDSMESSGGNYSVSKQQMDSFR